MLRALTAFGYLPKLKSDLGLVFNAFNVFNFPYAFSIRMFLIQYSINWASFNIRLLDISKNICFFKVCLINWWLRFIFDHLHEQWLTGRKKGKVGNTKVWILGNKKSFLDEIKIVFRSFWDLSFGEKKNYSRHKL